MNQNLRSLLVGALLVLFAFGGFRAYERKREIDSKITTLQSRVAELEKSAVAYQWLAEGVVTLPDGKRVSRAQLLDILLSKAVKPTK